MYHIYSLITEDNGEPNDAQLNDASAVLSRNGYSGRIGIYDESWLGITDKIRIYASQMPVNEKTFAELKDVGVELKEWVF